MIATETKEITLYGFGPNLEFTGSFPYVWAVGTGYAANSTAVAPPSDLEPNTWPVFNGASWDIKKNYKGQVCYSTETKEPKVIDYFGVVKSGYTLKVPSADYETWDGSNWVDQRTDAERLQAKHELMPVLTSRQFFLALVHFGLYDAVYSAVDQIEDAEKKLWVKVELDRADSYIRTNSSVVFMQSLLGITDTELDTMWEYAYSIPD